MSSAWGKREVRTRYHDAAEGVMVTDAGGLKTALRAPSRVREEGAKLPRDLSLLPLAAGGLLVSRGHAVFCRVPPGEVGAVRTAVSGGAGLAALSPGLLDDLDRHGFFGPPREAKPDVPTVQLQLTNACNLAYRYCCTNSGDARAEEVSYERMLGVVRQIPNVLGSETRVAAARKLAEICWKRLRDWHARERAA